MNEIETETAGQMVPTVDKGGVWVRMGDKSYKVAPLNFKTLREMAPLLTALKAAKDGELPTAAQTDALCSIAHASIRRNYPAITLDEVAENLDFGNFLSVLNAVMGASGLLGRKEEPESGEVKTSP